MYRINRLTRPVLIAIDEVLAKAVTDQDADIRYLLNSIEIAEERYIAPALGDAFYEDFITQKNVTVTSANQAAMLTNINNSLAAAGKNLISNSDIPYGTIVNAIELCAVNYQNLWNRFLWKIVAEAVDICSIVPSWTRSTAQGQMQNHPKTLSSDGAGSATADRKDIEYKIDTMMQQRLYPLIARMKKWIQQTGGYTLFPCERKEDGIDKQGKGGIILGLYDDRSYNGPNLWQWGGYGFDEGRRHHGGGTPAPLPPAPTPAPLTIYRSLEISIVTTPNPLLYLAVGGGHVIQAQYSPAATVTPMKTWDSAGYLAGRPMNLPIFLNGIPMPSGNYNTTTGTFSGGFSNGDVLTFTFLDNV
jgi:hypothetical protein